MSPPQLPGDLSVDEIHAEEVQYQAAQHVVRERPLLTYRREVPCVGGVGLDAQGRREDELADRRAEAGEEGIERLPASTRPLTLALSLPLESASRLGRERPADPTHVVPGEDAVDELHDAERDEEGEEAVEQLGALRRPVDVVLPQSLGDLGQGGGRRGGGGGLGRARGRGGLDGRLGR